MLLNFLEEMKHSNLKFSYKDAFDVVEEEVEVEMNLHIPQPDVWSDLMQVEFPENENIERVEKWTKMYKMNKLVNPILAE